MASTRPSPTWKSGGPLSARKLNEMQEESRRQRLTVSMVNSNHGVRNTTLPNGTALFLPRHPVHLTYRVGTIHSAGPGGEADFANEQYWVWTNYVVADKWGVPVNVEKDYPRTGTDLTDIIVPATNESERQPGGPAGSGTHVLQVGTPVYLIPVFGRMSSAAGTTMAQRYVFFSEDVGVGQYPGQVLVTEASHTRQWSFITAVPSLT